MFRIGSTIIINGLPALICGVVLLPATSTAADWSLSKGATATVVYTDNSQLDESQENSEFITLISPHVSLQGKGVRANIDLAGSFQIDDRGKGSDSLRPRLRFDADAELVRNFFFIDAGATATQNAIDPYAKGGSDTLSDSDNVTTTYSYKLSPYVVRRLKRFANLQARYTFDRVMHESGQVNNSNSQEVSLSLDSGPEFSRLSWGFSGNYKEIDYQEQSDSKFRSADVRLGYRFNRAWSARASLGKEWNEFTSTRSDDDGFRSDLKVKWTPSPRTSLEVGFGDRFFGSTPSLDFSHRSRRSTFTASYSRQVTESRTLVSTQAIYPGTDPFGEIIDPITGETLPVSRNLATLNDSTFVDERFKASLSVKGRRTTVTVTGDHSKQIYQNSQRDMKLFGFRASASRKLSEKISGNTSIGWRSEENQAGSDSDTLTINLGLDRHLGPHSSVQLNFGHSKRDSDRADDDYTENRVTLSASIDF